MKTPRPNILIIHSHDLGRHLGCYGVSSVHTPHLDAFAKEGVLFGQAFATAPQCSPSRASLFTGTWPSQNGVLGLCNPGMDWNLKPHVRHLGEILREAGYFTFGCGIIHETTGGAKRCGLESYSRESSAAGLPDDFAALLNRARADGRPFYGQVGFFEPHRRPADWADKKTDQGFLAPGMQADDPAAAEVPGYLADTPGTRTEIAELNGAVRALDAGVGRVLAALDAAGQSENTIVVFTTDHGVALPRAKCSLYDPGIEVAMMIRWPGGIPGGRRTDALYSHVDLVPTLLELLGLPGSTQTDARSWADFLGDTDSPPPERPAVFASMTFHDYYFPMRAVRTPQHKLIVHFSNTHAFMDPTQSWFHRSETRTPPNNNRSQSPLLELYDLETDPWEQTNLAQDPATGPLRRELLALLADHMRRTGDPLPERGFPSPRHLAACELLGFTLNPL